MLELLVKEYPAVLTSVGSRGDPLKMIEHVKKLEEVAFGKVPSHKRTVEFVASVSPF